MGKQLVCWLATCVLALGCGSDPYPTGPGDDTDDPDANPGTDPDASSTIDAGETGDAGDDLPPMIVVVSPTPGSMVAGVITLSVEVIDLDTIPDDGVTATIAGSHQITMNNEGLTSWVGTYDTAPLAGLVFPTIVVRARDSAGNESQVGFEVTLDNEAPLLGLDPPRVREAAVNADGILECSRSFDPVGSDAPDDGETVAQLIELRARVVDLPNTGTSTSPVYVPRAGVADDTVSLYVLDDTTRPLIVDSDADGICDAINPEIVPTSIPMTSNEAAVLDLIPVEGAGDSYFSGDMSGDSFTGSNNAECAAGTDTDGPAVLCLAASPATRVPVTPFEAVPMIYVIQPINVFACMGYAFDARASNISEGWACTVVSATDALGNGRISPVTRICIDADQNASNGCGAWGSIAPAAQRPDCTGTYNPVTEVVTSTPCSTPATFASSGVAGDYELLRTD